MTTKISRERRQWFDNAMTDLNVAGFTVTFPPGIATKYDNLEYSERNCLIIKTPPINGYGVFTTIVPLSPYAAIDYGLRIGLSRLSEALSAAK